MRDGRALIAVTTVYLAVCAVAHTAGASWWTAAVIAGVCALAVGLATDPQARRDLE